MRLLFTSMRFNALVDIAMLTGAPGGKKSTESHFVYSTVIIRRPWTDFW